MTFEFDLTIEEITILSYAQDCDPRLRQLAKQYLEQEIQEEPLWCDECSDLESKVEDLKNTIEGMKKFLTAKGRKIYG